MWRLTAKGNIGISLPYQSHRGTCTSWNGSCSMSVSCNRAFIIKTWVPPTIALKAMTKIQCFVGTLKERRSACACTDAQRENPPSKRVITNVASPLLLSAFLSGILLSLDLMNRPNLHWTLNSLLKTDSIKTITKSFTLLFLVSAATSMALGYVCIPWLRRLKAYQIFRREGPSSHFSKIGTPTMGGLFFVPVGAIISGLNVQFSSIHLNGLIIATLMFGAIGLLDDVLGLVRKHNYGLPGWCKFFLQFVAGTWAYLCFESGTSWMPSQLKTVVHFPLPLGAWDLGTFYLPLTAFCFVSMSNGVNLTDGLDGLAAGTAAAAFIGMTLAVQHAYPAVGIFGVSMAGACVGFLFHNHHRAAVFMGDTGSLALGAALAAMGSFTGMFFPLFIISGIFFLETVSVILQVFYWRYTKKTKGAGRRLFRMAPIHHHFELSGIDEPKIVAGAYLVSCCLALVGGYVGSKLCILRMGAW